MIVTATITTIGGSTFEACLTALRNQTMPCQINVVDHVAPFSAALQQMVDRCETPFCVQVDEDMILQPNGIERLVDFADDRMYPEAANNLVMATMPLWDVELGMVIYGVKVYRTELIKRVPFVDHPDGDINDRRRWEAAGLTWEKAPRTDAACVGLHGTHYTPDEAFRRWHRLMITHRRTGRLKWVEPWPNKLRDRYLQSGDRVALFAMLGAFAGLTASTDLEGGANFQRLDTALEAARAAYPE